ncbi:MAG: efflux RND transporter periplasmic adaptor subunit [Microbacter sp.]
MTRKQIIQLSIVILILAGGIIAIRRAAMKDRLMPIAKTYDITVNVIKPQMKQLTLTLPYLAVTQNDQDVMLASKISARVLYVVQSGNMVRKGQIVARLDNTSVETSRKSVLSQIASTNTALKNLQATHKRTLELLAVKGASIEQSENEESSLAALEAQLESLKQNLNDVNNTMTYATITSPVDGVVSKNIMNVGDMAMPGLPVISVSADKDFYLMVYVPSNLKVYGVEVNNKSYTATPLNTTLNGLEAYKVNVDVSGMTTGEKVEVNVVVFQGTGIELPFDAILNRNGENYVLVKNQNKAVPVQVTIVQSGDQGAVVSNTELQGKELVVAKQDILLNLLTGATIKTVEE